MIEYRARKATSLLPPWVREYQRIEEGPASITEQQTDLLWKKIDDLEQRLGSQAMKFEANYFALEKDMSELQGKYNLKKHHKRRDKNNRKRKRSDWNSSSDDKDNDFAEDTEGEHEKDRSGHEEEGEQLADVGHRESDGGNIAPDQAAAAVAAAAHYAAAHNMEAYAPYYQERLRYAGGWPGTGVRRFF